MNAFLTLAYMESASILMLVTSAFVIMGLMEAFAKMVILLFRYCNNLSLSSIMCTVSVKVALKILVHELLLSSMQNKYEQ